LELTYELAKIEMFPIASCFRVELTLGKQSRVNKVAAICLVALEGAQGEKGRWNIAEQKLDTRALVSNCRITRRQVSCPTLQKLCSAVPRLKPRSYTDWMHDPVKTLGTAVPFMYI
jgi:hypothetical protein